MRLAAAVLLAALCGATVHAQEAAPKPEAPAQAAPPRQELPIVRSIVVEGEERYSEAQIIGAVGQKVGEPYDPELTNRGLHTLWRSFSVKATYSVRELPTAAGARKEIELRIEVVESPSDREPRFVGNIAIDTKTLKRWAQIDDRVETFEYQASRVRQRMLEGYRREGYYWAEVVIVKNDGSAATALGSTPLIDLIFEIREGPKVRVKELDIRGNRSMPDAGFGFWKTGLSSFSKRQLSAPGVFNWFGSTFVEETLDADLVAMRNVYRERGFLDAVVEAEAPRWNDDRSEVALTILIDEGRPYVVDSLEFEFFEWFQDEQGGWETRPAQGKPRFTSAELLLKLRAAEHAGLEPGKRYEQALVERDELVLRDLYGSEGHLAHRSLPLDMRWQFLQPELFYQPAHQPPLHKVGVTYRIVEAHPLTLREISFAGTHHTRDEVLRREVKVFPGGKADLKEIERARTRIHGTGFFSDETSPEQHEEPTYRFIAVEGSKDLVDLEYQVEEGRVILFNLQGGISTNDGAFGLISLKMKNFDWRDPPSKWNRSITELFRKEALHGAGQHLELELAPGTIASYARVRYVDPDIFSRYLETISLEVELRQLEERGWSSHEVERFDKVVKFGRRFSFDTVVSVGVVHSDIDVSDLDSEAPAVVQRQDALGDTVQAGISLDARTQFEIDNFLNPHRGLKLGLRNTLFTDLLSSDFEYLRSDFQGDAYLPTGTKSDGTEHFLHFELDAGIEPTFGGTDEVPYTERFFQGGSNNIRGFRRRGAGPRATDILGAPTEFPAGGESYLSGSVEWLYPLFSTTQPGTYRQIEALRGVLFFDWGVLGPEAFEIDLEDMRTSIGFGVGLAYPLPVQLNFGFPMRKFSGDERQTFSFSIGLSF